MTPNTIQDTIPDSLVRRRRVRAVVSAGAFVGLVALVAASAVITKEARGLSRLDSLSAVSDVRTDEAAVPLVTEPVAAQPEVADPLVTATVTDGADEDPAVETETAVAETVPAQWGAEVRWFNARPVRPARTVWMTVTAYSPDSRSCGDSADGITSSIHNVFTNGGKLVAADSRILPLGSMISIPGYDDAQVVPVLDRGGAIKGHRLDLLFPTHEAARKWGVKHLPVIVWEYADGKPADDYRRVRDSKN